MSQLDQRPLTGPNRIPKGGRTATIETRPITYQARIVQREELEEAHHVPSQRTSFKVSCEDMVRHLAHPAEQVIRSLAVGRRNWLQIAGQGGLKSAAALFSVAASAKRHGVFQAQVRPFDVSLITDKYGRKE